MRFVLILVAVIAAFVLGPIATSIDAQKYSIEEDLEYARGLMNRRMHDLAKMTLDAIQIDPSDSGPIVGVNQDDLVQLPDVSID